jgi:hypothetical protein
VGGLAGDAPAPAGHLRRHARPAARVGHLHRRGPRHRPSPGRRPLPAAAAARARWRSAARL